MCFWTYTCAQQLTDKVYYAGSLAREPILVMKKIKRLLIYDLEQKQLISQTLEIPTKFLTIDKNSETILNQNLNSDNVEFRIKGTKEFISKIQEQTKRNNYIKNDNRNYS